MKKLLPLALVLALAAGVPGAWAKNSISGGSFGSSSFKSIRQMDLPSAPSARALTAPQAQAPVGVYHSPSFFFIPMPMFGGYGYGGGFGGGWILIVVVAGIVLFLVFRRRRVPAQGIEEEEEAETLEVMYDRCRKNLDTLTGTYLEAQTWLERLDGKVPRAQWKDWNDKFTRVSIDDFGQQLKDIRAHLDQGRDVAARAALFSFDEDAVAVFEFFRDMENTLEEVG
jgi:hypothetical protein